MNWELYDKYGERNKDGFYIENHEKWNHYAMNPKIYKIMTIKAWLFMLIPICGMIGTCIVYEEMGLSLF